MEISENIVIEWEDERRERVLRLSTDRSEWICIVLAAKRLTLKRYDVEELQAALDRGVVKILDHDPMQAPYANMPDHQIRKTLRRVRDRRWRRVREVFTNPKILDDACRSRLLKSVVPHRTGYRLLTRYLKCGQTPNALLADYDQCGAKGQPREIAVNERRRPPKASRSHEPTKAIREVFQCWLEEKYDKKTKPSLHDIFIAMSGAEWSCGFELNHDGTRVPKLLPQDHRPTEDQFRYYFNHYHDPERSAEQRMGAVMAARAAKVRDRDTRHLAFGPNSLWMGDGMDSRVYIREGDEDTEPDNLIRSTVKTELFIIDGDDSLQILGAPKIYAIGDVFTGAILIAYATLEEESYESIKTAFELATCDKVEYCRQHGITIAEHEWPFRHLPDAILTDRGPLRGKMGDHLAKVFGINVQTTAPYRPDLKGFIERTIRTIRQRLLNSLPGASRGRRTPGEEDPRLKTALTLKELNTLLITATLYHNNFRRRRNYPITPDMRRDGLQPYPIRIWRWGVTRRSGVMRMLPQEVIRHKLLPVATARMTEQGVYFGKLYYGSTGAFFHTMRFRAKHRGTFSVSIAFDHRLVDVVYLLRDAGREFVKCEIKGSSDRFAGRSWAEVRALLREERRQTTLARTRDDQGTLAYQTLATKIVKTAGARAAKLRRAPSAAAQVRGIRQTWQAGKRRRRVASARAQHGVKPNHAARSTRRGASAPTAPPLSTRRKRLLGTFNRVWKGGRDGRMSRV
ncbi:DDE-type integrase/transposase/recombinase [Nitrospira lenta]|uniref:Integrase catalytic domain-containing protein n=1 Tax=Nitrospira lenta TaxID=1436998 RepID=A0A330L471_9BACT|nr:DDE-type integrase/transposase/recombinase [Nitrospira lenta]SPP64614.1 hypothetical protein NITLEN_20254 [Nitrospira lenta]